MNASERIVYQIYPLGALCPNPPYGTGPSDDRKGGDSPIGSLERWIPHLKSLGINTLLIGPMWHSSYHGYDTIDYYRVDPRLGTNEELVSLSKRLAEEGIEIVFDTVFNHVGREFFAFRDLQGSGVNSRYRDWFCGVDFGRSSPYGDAFAYEGWAGHYELVKLNLANPDVRAYLYEVSDSWQREYNPGGYRMDAANVMDRGFLCELGKRCRSRRADFWYLGEMVGGDYRELLDGARMDSVTNYEIFKGIWSTANDRNAWEIASSAERQWGEGGAYRGRQLLNFVENHDVDRLMSTLRVAEHARLCYSLAYTLPGIPALYYGGEASLEGRRSGGDDSQLRPYWHPGLNGGGQLENFLRTLGRLRTDHPALRQGEFTELHRENRLWAFARSSGDDRVAIVCNWSTADRSAGELIGGHPLVAGERLRDLLSGREGSIAEHRVTPDTCAILQVL